jgi:hypothetical protein
VLPSSVSTHCGKQYIELDIDQVILMLYISRFVMAKHLGETHGWDYNEIVDEWAKEFEFPTLREEMVKLQDAQFADPFRRP